MKKLKDANEALEEVKKGGKLYCMVDGSYREASPTMNPFTYPDTEFYRIYTETEAMLDMAERFGQESSQDFAYTGKSASNNDWFEAGWNAHAEYILRQKNNEAY